MPKITHGLIHVYTGDGKGKTTAALGLALRAAGHGMRTYIGQFMKGSPTASGPTQAHASRTRCASQTRCASSEPSARGCVGPALHGAAYYGELRVADMLGTDASNRRLVTIEQFGKPTFIVRPTQWDTSLPPPRSGASGQPGLHDGKPASRTRSASRASRATSVASERGLIARKPSARGSTVTLEHIRMAQEGLAAVRRAMLSGEYDLVVMDEINVALFFKLLTVQDVLDVIDEKPEGVELVLTGRRVPEEILARADYVTEMREIKHPYQLGIQARKGIEF